MGKNEGRIKTPLKGLSKEITEKYVHKIVKETTERVIKKESEKLKEKNIIKLEEKLKNLSEEEKINKFKGSLDKVAKEFFQGSMEDNEIIEKTSTELGTKISSILSTAKIYVTLLIIASAGVAGTVSYFILTAVPVDITNDGCSTLYPAHQFVNYIPGLYLPDNISTGQTMIAKVPRIWVNINASSESGTIDFTTMGILVPFNIHNFISVQFDGNSILDNSTSIYFGDRKEHKLVVKC